MRRAVAILALALAGCSGRGGELDALIREHDGLHRLEQQLEWTLEAAGANPGLRQEQQRWRKGLERCLGAEDPEICVAEAHRERLEDLQARFGLTPRSVALHAARREGFEFRAMGNEPGWTLLISTTRCVWETDYGMRRQEIEGVQATDDGDFRHYRATLDGKRWEARLEPKACSDDMSGEDFPWTARIRFDGGEWRGCAEPTTR